MMVEGRAVHAIQSFITDLHQSPNHSLDIFKHKFGRNARGAVLILPGTGRWQTLKAADGGDWPPALHLEASPLHHAAHGPPPRSGEDPHAPTFARSSSISPAVAFALPTTPGMPAPGWVPAPTR